MTASEIIEIEPKLDGSFEPLQIQSGKAYKIILRTAVTLIRFNGPAFAFDKCFLLPAATKGIRALRTIFGETPGAEVLVVGHTDASGSAEYNQNLSFVRAKVMAAFLTEDVDYWDLFFTERVPGGKTWGKKEITQMLSVLPDPGNPYFTHEVSAQHALRQFQQDEGIQADGKINDVTRRALIRAYMGLDGTSLPPQTRIVAHGCGEARPRGGPQDQDRRVEVFLFLPKILPFPEQETSDVDGREYPQWLAMVKKEHNIAIGFDAAQHLELRLHDEARNPMPNVSYRIIVGKTTIIRGISDPEGFVFVQLPPQCPEKIRMEWGNHPVFLFAFSLDIFINCALGDSTSQVIARLNNLGYAPMVDLEAAVQQFQTDYEVDHHPAPLGLVDDALPPQTQQRLDAIFTDSTLNASIT